MKIDINNLGRNQNVDKEKTTYSTSHTNDKARIADNVGGYTLDISGTVTDNAAYGIGELRSVDDIMQDAGQKNITLQRNYMAVMSNSMSTEDFAKLQEEGYSVTDTSVDEYVTSLDKIKLKLAQAGTVIEGYNDDLSDDKIKAITGDFASAEQIKRVFSENDSPLNEEHLKKVMEAADKSRYINPLSEDVKKYMVSNSIEPTIENLYKSEYSAGNSNGRQAKGYYQDSTSGYYAKKADVYDLEQIRSQVEGVISRAGMEVNDDTLKEAEWIIKSGIPLTERAISNLDRLNQLSLPLSDEDILNISAVSLSEGRLPVNGAIDKSETDYSIAVDTLSKLYEINDDAIETVVNSDKVLNIKNLYEASKYNNGDSDIANSSKSAVTARRQLEEVRLVMSAEANLRLIKQGVSIETEPLEQLVNELREAEREFYKPLLLSDSKASTDDSVTELDGKIQLFKDTQNAFEQLKSIPSDILGRINRGNDFTASKLNEEGNLLKAQYLKAEKGYEPLMTAPRADMGDSIKKAFRNVDDILRDNGFDLSDVNRKAVRILGYSGMEINKSSIESVREADRAVNRVIELMTPAKTLEMIRNGHNPLDENIYELQNSLETVSSTDTGERYSRFLRKLESKNEISDREKEAFIGVYRLFRQIEKSDGRLIGNVIDSSQTLTLRNLLSASRSNKSKGMNVSVDDTFGGLEKLNKRGESISDQIDGGFTNKSTIEGYYNSIVKDVLDKMTPDALVNGGLNIDDTLEKISYNIIEQFDRAASIKDQYEQDMTLLSNAKEVPSHVIDMLSEYEQPVTVNNLIASKELVTNRGKGFNKLFNGAEKRNITSSKALKDSIDRLVNNFTSEESAKAAYDDFAQTAHKVIEEVTDSSDKYIEVRELNLLHKEISVATGLAKQDNYEIPVNINGEWTSINLKLVSNASEEGSVTATMNSEKYGRVAAKFIMSGSNCKGYVTSDRQDTIDALSGRRVELSRIISEEGIGVKELAFVRNDRLDLNDFSREEASKAANSADLYNVAKSFITFISK